MPPWFCQISASQRKEAKINSSIWVQLATIGVDNTPRVRTVVFRGWSDNYEMQIYSDRRSEKFNELDLNNNVEICWLFSKSKCQFRFRGKSKLDLGNDCIRHWEQLSEKSQSMWGWPCPGEHFVSSKNNYLSCNSTEQFSKNFVLMKVEITHVDQLLLNNPTHIRRRWIRKKEWIEERINP